MKLGQVVITSGLNEAIKKDPMYNMFVLESFHRYVMNDWGDTCEEDNKLNNYSAKNSERVVAIYKHDKGDIFIITEWDRSVTTILFTDEY